MAYQSSFSGDQMENVFRRVTNMITGTVEFEAASDRFGYGFAYDVPFSSSTPKIFTSLRDAGEQIPISDVAMVIPQIDLENGNIMFLLRGEGIKGGNRYAVDYFIID